MSLIENEKEQIVKGLLGFAVLVSLEKDERYGAELLIHFSKTPFATQAGTLYPLLNKLQRQELIEHHWVESPAGPPRKYYRLTSLGKTQLLGLREHWRALTNILEKS